MNGEELGRQIKEREEIQRIMLEKFTNEYAMSGTFLCNNRFFAEKLVAALGEAIVDIQLEYYDGRAALSILEENTDD